LKSLVIHEMNVNFISVDNVLMLAKFLKLNSSLTELDIHSNHLHSYGVETIIKALASTEFCSVPGQIQKLDFSDNQVKGISPGLTSALTSMGIENLETYNRFPIGKIRRGEMTALHLNDYTDRRSFGGDAIIVLALCLKSNHSLTSIDFSGDLFDYHNETVVGPEGVLLILQALAANKKNGVSTCPVHSLNLMWNNNDKITNELESAVQALGSTQWEVYNEIRIGDVRRGAATELSLRRRDTSSDWMFESIHHDLPPVHTPRNEDKEMLAQNEEEDNGHAHMPEENVHSVEKGLDDQSVRGQRGQSCCQRGPTE